MDCLLNECEVPYRWLWLDDGQTPVILDPIDYDWAYQWPWAPKPSRSRWKIYAYRSVRRNGVTFSVFLHVEICKRTWGPPPTDRHIIADHMDGQTLNCRRANLEWETRSGNRKNLYGAKARQGRLQWVVT